MAGEATIFCIYLLTFQAALGSISCSTGTDNLFCRRECSHSNANITLFRYIPTYKNFTSVNYYITRDPPEFVPATVEIYHDGETLATFQCENGSIPDRGGTTIGEVFFKQYCDDPTILVNHSVTVTISLDLQVILSDVDRACSSITIGPQRLILFSQVDAVSRQFIPFLQLLNVDTCNNIGPAIPIRLSTSINSSLTLYSNGSTAAVGNISVHPLPCNDSHTKVYQVSVSSTDNYSLYGEISNSLLPISCIFVPVSVLTIMEPTNSTTTPTNHPHLLAISSSAALFPLGLLVVFVVVMGSILFCKHKKNRKFIGKDTIALPYICSEEPTPAMDVPTQSNPAYEAVEAASHSYSCVQLQGPESAEVIDVALYDNLAYESPGLFYRSQMETPNQTGTGELFIPMFDNPAYKSLEHNNNNIRCS